MPSVTSRGRFRSWRGFGVAAGILRRGRREASHQLGPIGLTRALHSKDHAHELLGGVRERHVVVLALGELLGEVGRERGVPAADVLGGVVEGVAQVARAALLHVGEAVLELAGLVGGGRHPRVRQQLVRRGKPREVPRLRQDHGPHAPPHAGDGGDGRAHGVHDLEDGGLGLRDLCAELAREADGVLQLERAGGHGGPDGVDRGGSDVLRHVALVVAARGALQELAQVLDVCHGHLASSGELLQQGVDRDRVQGGDHPLQLGEQDAHQPRD